MKLKAKPEAIPEVKNFTVPYAKWAAALFASMAAAHGSGAV
jgi:hypothetical protein